MITRAWAAALVGIAVSTVGFGLGQGPGGGDLGVTVSRFFRANVGTTVEAFCRVPFALLGRVGGDQGAFGAYRLNVSVRDSSGLALTEQTWTQRVPARMLDVEGASTVEQFHFAAAAGRYTVEVSVTDSASGRVMRVVTPVVTFGARPLASDLLLSTAIRETSDSTTIAGGEVGLGGFAIAAQTEPVLTPSQSRLFYYVELYPGRPTTASVTARVETPEGRTVIATQPEKVDLEAAGVATSGLDLAGLPVGSYALAVEVTLGDTVLKRSAPFRMGGFGTEAAIAKAVGRAAADRWDALTEAQLDTLYQPLVYIMGANERGIFDHLSVSGKRNYLRQFWARRDPTPGTPANEEQEEFYRLMARADRDYHEGGAGEVPGWRTDRGRILVRYGEPDEVLQRPQSGPTNPYEVWKYTHGRPRKFVFLDQTGLGHYVLIYTDERREPSLANWEDLLGPEAVQDVQRF